jgi:hypothetical protein
MKQEEGEEDQSMNTTNVEEVKQTIKEEKEGEATTQINVKSEPITISKNETENKPKLMKPIEKKIIKKKVIKKQQPLNLDNQTLKSDPKNEYQ